MGLNAVLGGGWGRFSAPAESACEELMVFPAVEELSPRMPNFYLPDTLNVLTLTKQSDTIPLGYKA